MARECDDPGAIAWSSIFLAQSLCDASSPAPREREGALALCREGLSLFRRLGDAAGLAQGLNILGNIQAALGNLDHAKGAYEECLSRCRETGERRREMITLANLSRLASDSEDHAEARRLARQFFQAAQNTGFAYMSVLELGRIAPENLIWMGRAEQAAQLLGASAALQEAMNIRQQPAHAQSVARIEALARQRLPDPAFQSALAAGQTMSLDDALAFALAELEA
jgi:tetratricopeptide (TPR) repeat protein